MGEGSSQVSVYGSKLAAMAKDWTSLIFCTLHKHFTFISSFVTHMVSKLRVLLVGKPMIVRNGREEER